MISTELCVQLNDLVRDTLESTLKSERYDPKRVPTMALNLANLLRKRVREITTPSRYKIIAQVLQKIIRLSTLSPYRKL
ncbi:uncharacterized protein DEA37_0015218 [Paragonimus westermani]|uniref:Uncharacterized protein n=1 Tax=Paragonimus westermani TaxID=34504 RepID=A0A5J4NHK0_9TREM|nr:uncharacterized protein DEA37_0015218 [Paragonimus westermani]